MLYSKPGVKTETQLICMLDLQYICVCCLAERNTDVVHVLRVCLTGNIMHGMEHGTSQISIRGSGKCQADEAQHSFVFFQLFFFLFSTVNRLHQCKA